jgi:bifunctional non-homologous end joining protein LigD
MAPSKASGRTRTRKQSEAPRTRATAAPRADSRLPPKRSSPAAPPGAPIVAGVTITSPDRPVYPGLGLTKLDLARYYSDIAERMLPYVQNRPLTLVRCEKGVRSPDALRADCKFLRHEPGWHRWAKEPIRRVNIPEQKKIGEYLMVDSKEGLVALAQGDILEVHVWSSTIDHLEKPDRVVFDLDPGAAVPWEGVIESACLLRDRLAEFDLESWVKLTGGKGLHVVVPFRPERSWDDVFAFARTTAEAFVRQDPTAFTVEYGKRGRERKILVDYKRNHRAAVAVAAYSARARTNASISLPVTWRELIECVGSDAWTIVNVRERLQHLRRDPWKGFWASRQRLGSNRR